MFRLLILAVIVVPCIAWAQSPRAPYGAQALERDLTTRLPAFAACGEDQRRLGEPVDGRLRLSVMVNPEASLSPLMILENTTTNVALAECVGRAITGAYVEVPPAAAQTMAFVLTFDTRGVTLGTCTRAPALSDASAMDPSLERAAGLSRPRSRSGEFSSEMVSLALRRASGPIRDCYEDLLADTRDLAGAITVEFAIRMGGAVHEIVINTNTTGSLRLATCVQAAVATLHFDPGPVGGEVRYRYPFVFAPIE